MVTSIIMKRLNQIEYNNLIENVTLTRTLLWCYFHKEVNLKCQLSLKKESAALPLKSMDKKVTDVCIAEN